MLAFLIPSALTTTPASHDVVIIDGDVSYPPNSGKPCAPSTSCPLTARHRLTYIARGEGDAEANRRAIAYLASQNIAARIVDAPLPPKKGPTFYLRLAANLLSPLPYSAASHQNEHMRQEVREFAATHHVDLWQLEHSTYLYTLPPSSGPVVIQAHNVETLLWQRFYQSRRPPPPLVPWPRSVPAL